MKLNEIQQALKVPKAHRNTFANYDYRNAEDILEAVKPLLGDSVLTLSDQIVCVGGEGGQVPRYYVKATATFIEDRTATEETGHIVTAYAREEETKKGMDAAQITGAASSYARKYALNGLFLIDDTKDADHEDNSKPSVAAQKPATATKPADTRKARIKELLTALEAPSATVGEVKLSVQSITKLELTEANYDAIINILEERAVKDANPFNK
jgi:hypothetical protein